MVNYILILLLYSPILFLCLLYPLKNRFKIQYVNPNIQSFSLLFAILFLTFLLSNHIIQSLWYQSPIFGYAYSQSGWELFILVWSSMVLVLVLILSEILRIPFRDLFSIEKHAVYRMLKIGFVFTCITILLSLIFGSEIIHDIQEDNVTAVKLMSPKLLVLFSINTIVLIPIVEEIIFRGLLYLPLYQKVGRNVAIILTSYIFLHSHFTVFHQSIFGSLVIFIKGLILTWLYEKKRSLIYPIGLHILFNAWFVYLQLF